MKKPLIICSPQLGLNKDSNLGGEVYDHYMIEGLARLGNKIYVYLPKKRPYKKNINVIVDYAPFKHIPAIIFNILMIPYLFKTYKTTKFNILRVHNPYFVGIGAIIFKFFHPSVRLIATHHLIEEGRIFKWINQLTANKYDAITCVNSEIKQWLSKNFGIPGEKITSINNGVSANYKPRVNPSRQLRTFYKSRNNTIILYMGLLIDRKNPRFLLEVFKEIKKYKNNIKLIICGEGPLKKSLKDYVNMHSIKDVFFTGNVLGRKKIDFLNLCNIFILPSKKEGMPLAALEAMSCAKPVIMPRYNYSKTMIKNEEDGFLIASNEPSEWAKVIIKLADNPKLQKKIGSAARRKILRSFQWNQAVHNYSKILKQF